MPRHQVRVWAVVAVVFLATVAASSQTPALRVVSAGPTGELGQLADADDVRIVFSEPMIDLGVVPTGAAPSWMRLTPAVPGTFFWSGTRTLMFSPDANTPLPHATTFTVRVEGSAASVAGRTLGAPYEFKFTTPTVRLLGVDWYRKDGRFDRPAVLVLHFNQRVRPEDVLAHARVSLTPHDWTAPTLPPDAREHLRQTNRAGLDRFDAKVAAVQRVVSARDEVPVRLAESWDEERFPRVPEQIVLETTGAPPTDGWLTVSLDAATPSPDGPARQAAQSTVVKLDPTLFARNAGCSTSCDPAAPNMIFLTRNVTWKASRQALSIFDITDAAGERAMTPARELTDATATNTASAVYPPNAGFDVQPPETRWRVELSDGLTADDGQTLGYPWVGFVETLHHRPGLGLSGEVWEAGLGTHVPVDVRNVSALMKWIAPVNAAAILTTARSLEPRSPLRLLTPPGVFGETVQLNVAPDVVHQYSLDLGPALAPRATGLVWASATASSYVRRASFVANSPTPARHALVQVTNLGISVKDSAESTLVFVTRLDTGVPVPSARVAIIDGANRTQWRGVTGADGVALAPALLLRTGDRTPGPKFIVTAQMGDDVSFVGSHWVGDTDPYSWSFSYDASAAGDVLRGSVFTDRGAYRPGEDVRIKAVLRRDTADGVGHWPAGTAFDVRVRDARDREIDRRTIRTSRWSSAEWTWRVPPGGALGRYDIEIRRATSAGTSDNAALEVSGGFLVAAYRRPDFRVDATLNGEPEVLGSTLNGAVDARYLFGGALAGRPVRWYVHRQSTVSVPDAIRSRYPAEQFEIGYQPSSDQSRYERIVEQRTEPLAANGRLTMTVPTAAGADVASSYALEADVEDISGQHIANRASLVVHPASFYVAVSRPTTFVDTRTGFTPRFAAVDLAGRPVSGVTVSVVLLREEWVNSPPAAGERRAYSPYGNWVRREIPAGEWTIRTTASETPLQVPVRDGGCYILRATGRDAEGRPTRTDVQFYATGGGRTSWRQNGNRIDLTPERTTWKPGERARILIQSPWEQATALLTVEREGIRRHRTFTINSTQDTVDVPIEPGDIPNVYVSVLLIKGRTGMTFDADGTDIGRPAYKLGYVPLDVDSTSKRLAVDVSTDKSEYGPRQKATVSLAVRAPDGVPVSSEVTLWAMDYGLLSLTGYEVPDLVGQIYVGRSLRVSTEDSRVRLISRRATNPAIDGPPVWMPGGVIGGLAGGVLNTASTSVSGLPQDALNISMDGFSLSETVYLQSASASAMASDQFTVRSDFRPLAFWLGSATTDTTGRVTTTVTLPDSLTTYRVIAIAADDQSRFGSAERELRVTKKLSLLPELPRFLSTGDRASFGAVVTNSSTTAGTAVVTMQTLDPAMLQIGATSSQTVQLAPGASASVRFDGTARAMGRARVRMTVTAGADTDAFEVPLNITAPMRVETTAAYGETLSSASERLALPPNVMAGAGGLSVELASTALVGLGESARYVTDYPYECAEQKASRALTLLLASDVGAAFKLTNIKPEQYRAEATRAIAALGGYQCGNGGFSLWPGSCYDTASPYLTVYILHVMKVAEGLKVPLNADVVSSGLGYLQDQLGEKPPSVNWWPVWGASQAYAVKVLAEGGRKPSVEIGRLTGVAERLPVFALSYLADALVAMNDRGPRYQDVVRRLNNAVRIEADRAHVEEVDEAALSWLWNTNVRSTAAVLDGLSRRRDDPALVAPLVRWLVASKTNGRWNTTYENATALEALVAYYRAFEAEVPDMTGTVTVGAATVGSVSLRGRSTTAQQVQLPMADLLTQTAAGAAPALAISRTGTGRLYYTARVRSLAQEPPAAVDRGIGVERRYEPYAPEGTRPAATTFAAGDLIRVTVTITLRGEGRYLALTDPLPAGLEPIDEWFNTTARDLAQAATRVNNGGDDWVSIWRRGTFDHVEKHDDRVVGFATRLGSGRHEFTYLVRATTAGTFTAAGARVEAMYAPELTGKSAASTVTVR